MKAIAAVDKNSAIGSKGNLLFRIPSDLKHFRNETIGKTVIMGRKTLESMPGGAPLKGRNTIVVSRSLPEGVFWRDGEFAAYAAASREDALELAKSLPEAVVCGGEQIYKLFFEDCDELIITEVENEGTDPDAFFPDYKTEGRFKVYQQDGPFEENGIRYSIRRYKRQR